MTDETGKPVSAEATALGVAFAIAIGIGGVWLAIQRSDQFSAGDALVPVIVGALVGFTMAGTAIALYFSGHWPARPGAQWLSVPAAAGVGLLLLSGPPALQAGAAAGLSAFLLPLVIVGGAISRAHRQPTKRGQEPETPSGT
jgi:hypothetical protein